MRVHVLDDWSDTLRGLPSFARLSGHDVTIWTDAAPEDLLVQRLAQAEALVLFRERTQITRSLLERLPNLRLVSARGGRGRMWIRRPAPIWASRSARKNPMPRRTIPPPS